jgi:DNA-binding MarR family transcriptional regulator/GNAT superfamily N-acetyltransferase
MGESMSTSESGEKSLIDAVRHFNRFYTRQIGALEEGLLRSPFTLTEARILYEVAHHDRITATELRQRLGLDAGYLSRLLRGLQERRLIDKLPSDADGRRSLLALTPSGRRAFDKLDMASRADIDAMVERVPADARPRLLAAMRDIESLLGPTPELRVPYLLRPHQPGDMGWIVHRQAVLYTREYGWNSDYEALIAHIIGDFLQRFDTARDRCWIAEREGEIVGSIFLVKHPEREGVAKLRLLYVEPSARGLGIGARLVQEVTRFARQTGYHTLTLWTNSVLVSARRLYEAEGYRLVGEEPHHSFGHDLVGQTWELALGGSGSTA